MKGGPDWSSFNLQAGGIINKPLRRTLCGPLDKLPGLPDHSTMSDAQTLSRPPMAHDSAQRLMAAAVEHHRAGRLPQAVEAYGRVLALAPRDVAAANNLGVALRALGRREAAEACYRRALALAPDDASTLTNLGNVLRDLGKLAEAEARYRRALDLQADYRGALHGMGLVTRDLKRLDDSRRWLERAAEVAPDDADIAWDLAQTVLCLGDYRAGFALYETRWRLPGVTRPVFDAPAWTGGSLKGGTLLLHGEQGFGDVIQFARFAPLAARRAEGPVVLQVRPELVPFLDGQLPGVERVVATTGPVPRCTAVAPLLSVPHLLGLTREDVPRGATFRPVARRISLPPPPPGTRMKVALCWQGSPTQKNDRNRSLPFAALLPLLAHAGAAFYSVQKGDAAKDPARWGVGTLVPDLDPVLADFADSSAVLAAMDLVITADTSVLHVAASMGKPVWVPLSVFHDWRFDGRDSIDTWYSTVRVFKQATPGDWDEVVERIGAALGTVLAGPA